MTTNTAAPASTNYRNAKLTLADIEDVRAYERGRTEFRARIIALKALRRVHLGTVVSLVFENRETMRFQIQEMARVEKLVTDEAIQTELNVYNPLIPDPGMLSATLFIECTTDDQMREWFPKLVGIERSIEIRVGTGANPLVATSVPDSGHDAQLTREDLTAAVHYISFVIGAEHAQAFANGPVTVAIMHPNYLDEISLTDGVRAELALDLVG
jgi:Protein of unknown function (DUF3501)